MSQRPKNELSGMETVKIQAIKEKGLICSFVIEASAKNIEILQSL